MLAWMDGAFAAARPNYWVIDPDEPSLRAWHLLEGEYRLVAHVTGDEVADLGTPWPIRVVPHQLLAAPTSWVVRPALAARHRAASRSRCRQGAHRNRRHTAV